MKLELSECCVRCPKCGKNTLTLDHMDEYFKCKNCGYKEPHETG